MPADAADIEARQRFRRDNDRAFQVEGVYRFEVANEVFGQLPVAVRNQSELARSG